MPTTLVKRATRTRKPSALPLPAGTARIRNGTVRLSRPKYDGLKMSLQDFLDWEREPDGWKYEWNNGVIEINEASMKNTERMIVFQITKAFSRTKAYQNDDAIFPETDCLLHGEQVRRPDLAYFTREQIIASKHGEQPIPPFVIELISTHDKAQKLESKLDEYFAAGVQCVWYVHPDFKRVMVYSSRRTIQVCTDDDVCSASPALDFAMTAHEIFT
ncbi:MAG: Uma2 family endonuclease [Candidatus Kapaibacteriota bacterium]